MSNKQSRMKQAELSHRICSFPFKNGKACVADDAIHIWVPVSLLPACRAISRLTCMHCLDMEVVQWCQFSSSPSIL